MRLPWGQEALPPRKRYSMESMASKASPPRRFYRQERYPWASHGDGGEGGLEEGCGDGQEALGIEPRLHLVGVHLHGQLEALVVLLTGPSPRRLEARHHPQPRATYVGLHDDVGGVVLGPHEHREVLHRHAPVAARLRE